MDRSTRDRLNALNARFYAALAREWDVSRERPWPGFARVLGLLPDSPAPRVLDVGCGNGRLVAALRDRFGDDFEYIGVDASAALLALAKARFAAPNVHFVERDFVSEEPARALPAGEHALVTLLAVLHHVPSYERRRGLIEAAAARLAPGGLLALTFWRFDRDPRFERLRFDRAQTALHVSTEALEPGDALLRFGASELPRYCHFTDDAERAALTTGLGLDLVASFASDGAGDRQNDYRLLRRSR